MSGLPNGLTEKAIAAALRSSLCPRRRMGAVSMYYRIEYNLQPLLNQGEKVKQKRVKVILLPSSSF